MKDNIQIREISPQETYVVRHPVLREGRPIEDCRFDGDELSSTYHLGLFDDNVLVGVASLMKHNHVYFSDTNQYQLRGMAVLKSHQGQKLGDVLFAYAETLLKTKSIPLLWFNAREVAVNFYKRNGAKIVGNPFEIDGIGTHYVMFKNLKTKKAS